MWFTRVSIQNPVMATMVMLALMVLGLFSLQRLKIDQFPNVEFPTIVVQHDYTGASPEIIESEVTRKVEEAVNTIAGINQLTSRSYEGTSVVIVQFNLDMDSRKAADDVREKVALIRPLLRDEVGQARVMRFDPSSRPIYTLALSSVDGQHDAVALSSYADQTLKPQLENVRGVGSVTLVGARKREINIYLQAKAMEAFGVGVDQVVAAVRNENTDLPAGALRSNQAERVVQIDARFKNPEDFRQLIVARRAGLPIRLGQIAQVVDGPEEAESLALYNGKRTLGLQMLKSQGENTIEVVDGLQAAVTKLRATLPKGLELNVVTDNSRPIRTSVKNVRQTLLEGALLTIGIVFLFLNSWRSTVITGLTLPISVVGTFLFMHAFGFTINMITLMALSLCVGLLIDDAIVVRENIVRHAQMGKDPRRASLDGTSEIGLAVLATTLSIVAVFLPIGFMGGIIGKFFHEFGITIVSAVMISMFVSFTLDPMLSSVWHDPTIKAHGTATAAAPSSLYDRTIGRVTAAVERGMVWTTRIYQDLLRWSLHHRKSTLAAAALALGGSIALVPLLGTEFVPKADFSETFVSFYTPPGTPLEVTEARAQRVDEVLRAMPEVRYTMTSINTGMAQGRNNASMSVKLVDRKDRSRNVDQMSAPLRQQLASIPGITVTHVGLLDAVGGQKPLLISLQGPGLAELQVLSQKLSDQLRAIPGLTDLDTSMKPNKPTVSVKVKRDAASDLGLTVNSVTQTLRGLVSGSTVSNWRAPDGENHDVNVVLAPNERESIAHLSNLGLSAGNLPDGSPRIIRLGQVADFEAGLGANQINRRDMNREVEITANVSGRSLGEVSADINRVLSNTQLPNGFRWRFGGSTKDMQESFSYALSALAMAVIFIYMILASQFKSFIQPIALMSSLPLTLIGVVLTLLMFRSTLNMFSVIGVVMLMGLVTKNAILLVDFANRARLGLSGEGNNAPMDRNEALLLAADVRLRPILMTTLAMIFGMVPLAFGLSEGSEQRAPMGQAVIGGVITSSLLTLVVVPVIYCYLDDWVQWWARRRKA